MIISHKYKFIFIKTNKTAGSSIEVFLSQVCDEKDVFTIIRPPVEPHYARNYKGYFNPFPELFEYRWKNLMKPVKGFMKRAKYYNHIPALRLKSRVPKQIWNTYYKFCVERNPWDKVVSRYSRHLARRDKNLSFDDYLENWKLPLNYPRYTDWDGNVLVDEIVKYENLNEGLQKVFGKLGIEFDGNLGVQAKSGFRIRQPYQEYFSKSQAEFVEKVFKDEIKLHGYKFN